MKKERVVLRVYDKNEKYSLYGECYYLVMPEDFDLNNLDDYFVYDELYRRLIQVNSMKYQDYTSYVLGVAEIAEDEMFWSEITNYELMEVKINTDRVKNKKYYKLPIEMIWKPEYRIM